MADSGGGSTNTKTVQTTQNTAPWDPTQPGLKQGISDWTDLYNSGGLNVPYYPGQTVADTAPETTAGWNSITGTANDPNSGVGAAQKYNNGILSGDYSAIQPIIDAAKNSADMSYEGAGRYGSGSHDKAVASGVSGVIAQAAQGAVANAPALQSASYVPGQALESVGAARQGSAQDQITAAIQKYNYDKNGAATAIQQYMAGLPGGSGSSTIGTQPIQTTSTNPYLQGGGLLASLLGSAAGSYFGS